MFENEWFPYANAIGVSWQEFWGMNPHIINLIVKGRKEKIKQQDYLAWLFNQYTLSAVSVAVEHNFAGKKAKQKYVEKPFMISMEEKEYEKKCDRPEYKGMTDKQKEKAELERAKEFFNSFMKTP